MTITKTEYSLWDEAISYFNEKLFDGKLSDVIVTYSRKKGARGYYHQSKFSSRKENKSIDEISMNPDSFVDRDDFEILSTLAHELCHHWQACFGEPSRNGYHNREWGAKMKEIGLYPSSTGEPDGKEVGQRMTHYVIDGGKFEIVAKAFLLKHKEGLALESLKEETKERKTRKKTRRKYTCPSCMDNIWGKPNLEVMCAKDKVLFVVEEEENTDDEN